jgi:hypothetical protein
MWGFLRLGRYEVQIVTDMYLSTLGVYMRYLNLTSFFPGLSNFGHAVLHSVRHENVITDAACLVVRPDRPARITAPRILPRPALASRVRPSYIGR